MLKFTPTLFVIILWSSLAQAQNWYPFPFKSIYYGKRSALNNYSFPGAPSNGLLVNALRLDSSWVIGGETFRGSFPVGFYPNPSMEIFPKTYIRTSIDSSKVSYYTLDENENFDWANNVPYFIFYPKKRKQGELALKVGQKDYFITSISKDSVLGVVDSVIVLETNNNPRAWRWSKKFGLISFYPEWNPPINTDKIEFCGAFGLGIGFQDFSTGNQNSVPVVGDEFHYDYSYRRTAPCNQGSEFNSSMKCKAVIKAYPYQNNSGKVLVHKVVFNPSDTFGIEYDEVQNILPYKVRKIGWADSGIVDLSDPFVTEFGHGFSYLNGWYGDDGMMLKIHQSAFIIDLGGIKRIYAPAYFTEFIDGIYGNSSSWLCFTRNTKSVVPKYIKTSASGTAGVPFPDVVIVGQSPKVTNNGQAFWPNPAQDKLFFPTDKDISKVLIYDLSGKLCSSFQPFSSGKAISIAALPKGLYHIHLLSSKGSSIQKLIKE